MNFISECTLRSRKLDDGEERREYVALSEVKKLFEKYQANKVAEMEKMKYKSTNNWTADLVNSKISACQKILEDK